MFELGFGTMALALQQRRLRRPDGIAGLAAWFDPSDTQTLYQDTAMLTAVTADGDPVGAMRDKSGNGNHLTQATAAARPTYRTDGTRHWLEFDGVDDVMATASPVATSGTDYYLGMAVHMNAVPASSGIFGDALQNGGGVLLGTYSNKFFCYSNPGASQATRSTSAPAIGVPAVVSLFTGTEYFAYDNTAGYLEFWGGANNYVPPTRELRLGQLATGGVIGATYFSGGFYGAVYAGAARPDALALNSYLETKIAD